VVAFLIAGALIATFAQCRVALNSIGWGAAELISWSVFPASAGTASRSRHMGKAK